MSEVAIEPAVAVPAGEEHVGAFLQEWVPFHALSEALEADTWTYRIFPWELIIRSSKHTTFAAVVGGSCEGLIALQRRAHELKVTFLATAPWNYGNRGRRGIGTGLLAYAVQLADDEGFYQVTLDSTPEAEAYYDRIGWTRTGTLGEENLPTFRLTSERFEQFLGKYHPLTKKE